MIGKLKGIIVDKNSDGIVLDVNGVGYDVNLPLNTLAGLSPTNTETVLWIHTNVREDELKLFGFATKNDRLAFRTMLKVNGVGSKVALAVIGVLSGDQLAIAVNNGDAKRLTTVPGIGKKTSERIIWELGGKLTLAKDTSANVVAGVFSQLSSALTNLGFKQAKVDNVIEQLQKDSGIDTPFEILLREGLAKLQG